MKVSCRENLPLSPFSRLARRMPRSLSASLLLLFALGVALALGSCGEEDAQLLPGETAREITANLDAVRQLADEGDCIGAEAAAEQVSEQIEGLSGVDARLKQALENGAARLNEVIAECEESTEEAIAPATIPEEEEEEDGSGGKGKGNKDGKGDQERQQPQEEPEDTSPSLPPQAEGEGKGLGKGKGESPSGGGAEGDEEEQSGGVGPGSPAGEGE